MKDGRIVFNLANNVELAKYHSVRTCTVKGRNLEMSKCDMYINSQPHNFQT